MKQMSKSMKRFKKLIQYPQLNSAPLDFIQDAICENNKK
jgi:hypothetical protein